MNNTITPGKYTINNITIVNEGGAFVDLKEIFVEMNIYEGMYSSCISGDILVTDTNNLISGIYALPIMGNELLLLNLSLPTWYTKTDQNNMVPEQNTIQYIGRITSIRNRTIFNEKSQSYLIEFSSEELLLSNNSRISKSYSGLPHNIASSIFETLKSESSSTFSFNDENTMNSLKVVIPNWHPLKAINWLASRSLSSINDCPTFFFYQTLFSDDDVSPNSVTSKFWYISLDNCLSFSPRKKIYFGLASVDATDPMNYSRAINYEIKNNFNLIDSVNDGLYANKLITHDILKKQWKEHNFDYYKDFDKTTHLEKGKFYKGTVDAKGEYLTDKQQSRIHYHSTGNSQSENFINRISGRRASQLAVLDNFVVDILIPGDGLIYSGDIIDFALKSPESSINSNNEVYDLFYSGKYLVVGIRHNFISENYTMTLRCSKESIKVNVEEYKRLI